MSDQPRRIPENGVYACPADTVRLRAGFATGDDLWRIVDLTAARPGDKAQMLAAFAGALEFPAGFGHNWDAFADSLQDLAWLEWRRLVIEVRGADRALAGEAGAAALDILREAATYWALRGRVFLVLADDGQLPAVPGS